MCTERRTIMNDIVDSFESRLKYAMSLRGKSQADITKHFGWSRSTVSQYCNPHLSYKPKADRMYQIAEYLNVSPTWLMGYDVPMNGMNEKEKLLNDINNMDNRQIKRFMTYMKAFQTIDGELGEQDTE